MGDFEGPRAALFVFLATLAPLTLERLYREPHCAAAVYRLLPPVAQYTVQRLLWARGATPFEGVRAWHAPRFRPAQNPALLLLKQLHILQGRSGEVWLSAAFCQSLLAACTGAEQESAPHGELAAELAAYAEAQWEVAASAHASLTDRPFCTAL